MPRERTPSIVGLIPARAGSKRVKNKNIKPLAGHPVMAYTISAALESGVFGDVIVSTDSEQFAEIARHYGASVPFLRPDEYAGDRSPDIEWIEYTLGRLRDEGKDYDCFSILRPTSPFRKARDDPAGLGHVPGRGGRRLAAGGREVQAAPGQDVGGARPPDVPAAADRPEGAALAQQPVPDAARGVHPERQPGDRLVARDLREPHDRRRQLRPVHHRGRRGVRRERRGRLDLRRVPRRERRGDAAADLEGGVSRRSSDVR